MPPACPRIIIGGTSSGVGKTSVSLALVHALKKRGLKVQPFKVGPDFLDPTYLSLASGRNCFNLDGWMSGREYVESLFARETADADIAVIEGVMGFYDGADSRNSSGSTAEIAKWLSAPALLTVNARGMARSIAAMVKGYCELEKGVNISGIVANYCGSKKHKTWLSESLDSETLPPLVGAIPKGAFPELPSRHLGLVTAGRKNLDEKTLEKLSSALEESADVDGIIKIARNAAKTELKELPVTGLVSKKQVKVGVAFDEAFHFYYADTLKMMESLGCQLTRFSPLKDEALPDGLDALYIGGGYPEEHAEALSANRKMLAEVKKFAESGKPLYAECGGLIYLSEGIRNFNDESFSMASVLPSFVRMRKAYKNLGYVETKITSNTIIGREGDTLRGHRFHYSELESDPSEISGWSRVYSLKTRRSDENHKEGYCRKGILASYVHAHLASKPEALRKFIVSCGGN